MPLPFLKPKPVAGVIVTQRKADGGDIMQPEEDHGLLACAEDLIRGIHSKDAHTVKEALKALFELMESMPHEEGPHTNESKPSPHTYEAQNIKAGK